MAKRDAEKERATNIKIKLLDELNSRFTFLVEKSIYLQTMTLANLQKKEESGLVTLEWNFDNEPLPSVYYRAFEKKPDTLNPTTGQYANPAIQTVYAFGITAMLISSNSTMLERHASYVAEEGADPFQNMLNYAKKGPPSLLKKAIPAVFSKNQRKKFNKIIENEELSGTKLLTYLEKGELNRADAGAAGQGFPVDSDDGAGTGAAGLRLPSPAVDSDDGAGTGAAGPGLCWPAVD